MFKILYVSVLCTRSKKVTNIEKHDFTDYTMLDKIHRSRFVSMKLINYSAVSCVKVSFSALRLRLQHLTTVSEIFLKRKKRVEMEEKHKKVFHE